MRYSKVLFLFMALALASLPAQAATYYVSLSGNNLLGDGSQGNPWRTIQYAYNQTEDGDTILVAEGTYRECLFLSGIDDAPANQRSVHLLAEAFDPQDPNTRALTVITPVDALSPCPDTPAITAGGYATTIEGFTITGAGRSGVFGVGNVTITNNIIESNSGAVGGGLFIYPENCFYGDVTVTITNNMIRNNTSVSSGDPLSGVGGGLFVGLYPEEYIAGDPLVDPGACRGGGSTVLVENNTIENNTAEVDGGGLYAFTNSLPSLVARVQITQNTIAGNDAGIQDQGVSYGGGIFTSTFGYGTEEILVQNNLVQNNSATGAAGASYGGGIWTGAYAYVTADHSVTVDGNTVSGNSAGTGGGLEAISTVWDMDTDAAVEVLVTNNTITQNTASTDDSLGGGGGLSVGFSTARTNVAGVTFEVSNNSIIDNNADFDGAGAELRVISESEDFLTPLDDILLPSTAVLDFKNNLVVQNESSNALSDAVGGGLMVFLQSFADGANSVANIDLNTIADNVSQVGSGGIEFESYTGFDTNFVGGQGKATLRINSTILTGNTGFGLGGPFPQDEGIFNPGVDAGDTGNQNVFVSYSDFFANGQNVEDWIPNYVAFTVPNDVDYISQDPAFDIGTYEPQVCTVTVDGGDPAFDFSLEPNPNGARVNMGHLGNTPGAATSPADASGDGTVDGIDVLRVAVAFGSAPGGERWNVGADIDGNDLVDGDDLALIAADYGESCP